MILIGLILINENNGDKFKFVDHDSLLQKNQLTSQLTSMKV